MNKVKIWVLVILALTTPLMAEGPDENQKDDKRPDILKELKLDKKELNAMRSMMKTHRKEMNQIKKDMKETHKNLMETLDTNQADQSKINQHKQKLMTLNEQKLNAIIRHKAEINKHLSKEQRATLKDLHKKHMKKGMKKKHMKNSPEQL